MGLTIQSTELEQLVSEVALLAHETEVEAIHQALVERRARLQGNGRLTKSALLEYLTSEVWPLMPPDELGRTLTRDQEERILGIGPDGV